LDVGSLRFPYSILAACAFAHMVEPENLALQVSGAVHSVFSVGISSVLHAKPTFLRFQIRGHCRLLPVDDSFCPGHPGEVGRQPEILLRGVRRRFAQYSNARRRFVAAGAAFVSAFRQTCPRVTPNRVCAFQNKAQALQLDMLCNSRLSPVFLTSNNGVNIFPTPPSSDERPTVSLSTGHNPVGQHLFKQQLQQRLQRQQLHNRHASFDSMPGLWNMVLRALSWIRVLFPVTATLRHVCIFGACELRFVRF